MSGRKKVDSGNKLQRQKKGPWSLEERKLKVTHLEEGREGGERHRHAPGKERILGVLS